MLEHERFHLRTVKEGDLVELYRYLDSIRHKGEYLPSELLSESQFRTTFHETGFWEKEKGTALIVLPEGRLMGALWYEKEKLFDCLDLRCYIFQREDRGQGIMTLALPLFCRYLFATQKVERLQFAVPDYCKAALHLAKKAGFQFEGIARSSFFHRGKFLDLCIYSLLRTECKGIETIYE